MAVEAKRHLVSEVDAHRRSPAQPWRHWIVVLLAALVLARLVSLALYPLGDTTEARYGEVARLMLASGDWITPQNDPGVPFWAKPPLSFWAQAATMALFGVNEFGARVSSLGFALAVLALLWPLARAGDGTDGRDPAPLAALLLLTMPLYFLMAGTVMTDMALALCTTAAMTGFWRALCGERRWGYVFFAGLGAGLLAKGPVALALVGVALGLWWLVMPARAARVRQIWHALPWPGGIVLMLAIAVPWYAAAEWRTPGFLHYFLVGEHFQRFVEPDWQGDRYGNAHHEPKGMVWLFMMYAALTWLPLLALLAWQHVRANRGGAGRAPDSAAVAPGDLDRYLLCWTVAAPLFFTAASNTIWSYVLPSLPALALLLARAVVRGSARLQSITVTVATVYVIAFSILVLWWLPRPDVGGERSTRAMLEKIENVREGRPARIRFVHHLPHSTKFYSRNGVSMLSFAATRTEIEQPGELFLIVAPIDLGIVTPQWDGPWVERSMQRVGRFGPWLLLHRR